MQLNIVTYIYDFVTVDVEAFLYEDAKATAHKARLSVMEATALTVVETLREDRVAALVKFLKAVRPGVQIEVNYRVSDLREKSEQGA